MPNAPSKNVKSVNRWSPNPAPVDPLQLPDYLFNELNRVGDIIFNLDTFRLEPTHTPTGPLKPRAGDIRYADGSDWNPGGTGEGIYAFFNNTWNKL
jgi:hypothetical protein|tara:strand:- start:1505 stop:1792 length:288 start_codon:yes stop_codon:yes gene_type:complete